MDFGLQGARKDDDGNCSLHGVTRRIGDTQPQ